MMIDEFYSIDVLLYSYDRKIYYIFLFSEDITIVFGTRVVSRTSGTNTNYEIINITLVNYVPRDGNVLSLLSLPKL